MSVAVPILALAVAAVLIWAGWRVVSRRRSLPCPVWLRWFVELDNPVTRVNRAAAIVGCLELRPGMRVVDVGCGPGRVTIPIARAVNPGEVVAMDLQPGMLARLREKVATTGVTNVTLLEAGAGDGKLGHARFDRALLVTVLGEVPNQAAAMREVFEALEPGGLLAVTETVFDPHFQSRAAVRRLAAAAGFGERRFVGGALAYTLVLEKRAGA